MNKAEDSNLAEMIFKHLFFVKLLLAFQGYFQLGWFTFPGFCGIVLFKFVFQQHNTGFVVRNSVAKMEIDASSFGSGFFGGARDNPSSQYRFRRQYIYFSLFFSLPF